MKKDYLFQSETDTEVACALIDSLYKKNKNKLEVFEDVKKILKGSYAFLILFADEKDTIYAIREGSPLIVATSSIGNFVASDIPAILEYTKNYYFTFLKEKLQLLNKTLYTFFKIKKKFKKNY